MEPTIASLMTAAEQGDGTSAESLFAALYSELHRIAKRELGRQAVPATLSPTTLLHEASIWLRATGRHSLTERDSWDTPRVSCVD